MDEGHLHHALRRSGLAETLQRVSFPVTLTDANDQFVFANTAFEKVYGWLEAEVIGLKPTVLLQPDYPCSELAKLKREMRSGGAFWRGLIENRKKSGESFVVELASFQVASFNGMPANLGLGVSAPPGQGGVAIQELVSCLFSCRSTALPMNRDSIESLPRHKQVQLLMDHGYSVKEIAGILGVDLNTPYVILHRARCKTR